MLHTKLFKNMFLKFSCYKTVLENIVFQCYRTYRNVWQGRRRRDTDSSARIPGIMANCAPHFIYVNTTYCTCNFLRNYFIYRTKFLLLFLCIHVFHKNKSHVICTKFENLYSFTLFSTSALSSKFI